MCVKLRRTPTSHQASARSVRWACDDWSFLPALSLLNARQRRRSCAANTVFLLVYITLRATTNQSATDARRYFHAAQPTAAGNEDTMINPIHAMLASSLLFGGVSAVATQTTDKAANVTDENRGLRAEEKSAFAEHRAAFRNMTSEERKVADRGRWNKLPRRSTESKHKRSEEARSHVEQGTAKARVAAQTTLRKAIIEKKLELRDDKKTAAHENAQIRRIEAKKRRLASKRES